MILEKKHNNIQWFKKDKLRIRVQNEGKQSIISVLLDGYNICFKLMMFDFVDRVKKDLLIDVRIEKLWDRQRVFTTDSKYEMDLINYLETFINEWNIKINTATVSDSDIISEELWYQKS